MKFEPPTETMTDSMSLDGDIEALAAHYARWAATYDADVASHDYGLPQMMVETLLRTAALTPELAAIVRPDCVIVDAGCGTGLVGEALGSAGFRCIDGVDLSAEMVEAARRRRIYRNLYDGVDLNEAPPAELHRSADVVVVAGVLTLGHVPPRALTSIAKLARPGGLLIVSTRRAYYETSDYQRVSDDLIATNVLSLLVRDDNRPYTMDSTATYWSYLVH